MAGFNINNLLNKESMKGVNQDQNDQPSIHYTKIIPNPKNKYSISNIEELADDIEFNGLQQNLLIKLNEDGDTYTIVAGHRRREAIRVLVEERGLEQFAEIKFGDYKIVDADENELKTRMKHHTTNLLARSITEYEKMEAIKELEEIYTELDKIGMKPKGKMREIIAKDVGLKDTQVQKYMSIAKKADEETLSDLQEGNITVDDAYKKAISSTPADNDEFSPEFDGDESNEDAPRSKKDTASKDPSKIIKKKVGDLRKLLEESNDEELLEYITKLESILIERSGGE